jgi:predicted Zn-dependent peptidase
VGGQVRSTTLPSGLRVITEQMMSSRTFSVGFFVGVGARTETDKLHGASHFLEHVLFKGTPTRTAEQISGAVESVGGDLNAYTAKEHTCFYARVLAADAELAVDVLSDMLTSSLVTDHDVDAERAVILDEIAMHADDPGEQAQELITRALFGDTGLGRPVIGSVRSIKALRPSQVTSYWRRHYVPSRLVVAAAGAVDHDQLVAQLSDVAAFAVGRRTPRTPRGERHRPTTVAASPGVITRTRPSEQATAVLAVPGPGLFDDERYAVGLLGLVLGGGMSSRLFVEVRERRGLAYGIEAGEVSYTDAGVFSVDWQCAPDRLVEIAGIVTATIADIAEHGVTAEELARSKGQMRGQTVLGYEGPGSRMSRLGSAALTADERGLDELLDRYDAVEPADVQRSAAALLAAQPVFGVVGPRISRRKLDAVLRPWG